MRDHRKLIVWERAHALTLRVYAVTSKYPASEQRGLVDQTRRAAASIGSNIAEGNGRRTDMDYARFLRYAAGSANEVDYHLLLAKDLGYIAADVHREMSGELRQIRAMLTRLEQNVRERARNDSRPP
jgi:four helix bundle protein